MFILKCCLKFSKGLGPLFRMTCLSFILAHAGGVSDLNSLSPFLLPQHAVFQIGMQSLKISLCFQTKEEICKWSQNSSVGPFCLWFPFSMTWSSEDSSEWWLFFSLGNFWSWGKCTTKYYSENWWSLYAVWINFAFYCFGAECSFPFAATYTLFLCYEK